ncbi:MAG: histidine--tRNA ligase [Burkholderiales bacterium]|jgi:histidyl-tRNA synthetase|nr:histidine--tRNA ligase [Burkholderiales bacterium]
MSKTLQAIKGMNDILPDESPAWQTIEDAARVIFEQYGYRFMRTPVVEFTPLFVRGIGEATDVVEKEMYTFEDKLSNESLTLRPEGTAGIVRAAIEHNLTYGKSERLWTTGAMFRHEKPQKGRYRQFYQLDVEALNFAGPDIDAEHIVMLGRLWKALGIEKAVRLKINSIGDIGDRTKYRETLVQYFSRHQEKLDEDSQRRLTVNPLRILDSKNPSMQTMIENAPRMLDLLNEDARAHFETLQTLLTHAGIAFEIDTRLVRGLDYYNRTVFEWVTDQLGSQGTVAGGGRYDGLFQQLGGKPVPACGFAAGIERLVLLLNEVNPTKPKAPLAYVVSQGVAAKVAAWRLAETLRDAGHTIVLNADGGNFKSQLKKADACLARLALILGDDELARQEVTVKWLREEDRAAHPEQEKVDLHVLGDWLNKI